MWEIRAEPRHFLNSRVLCWVAVDRAIRLAVQRGFPFPLKRWRETRDEIYEDVYGRFWNPDLKAFTQYQGANVVDASALLMPLVKFIGPTDPQWHSTLKRIQDELVADSLVHRYNPEAAPDGVDGPEGSFSVCSFWYVECLARAGDLRRARFLFEKMLGYSNHLGLYAEQLGPSGEHLGNFPQVLTHLALISAAWNLDQRLSAETAPN
jgi:GH15 family glucan-1,4-alpha-glucosidase